MKKEPSNGAPKISRQAKKFAERFDKLYQAYLKADDPEIDDALADFASHLMSDEDDCIEFLHLCTAEQLKAALLVLDDVALQFPHGNFLRALKYVQRKYPQFDLTTCMDASANSIAEHMLAVARKKDRHISPDEVIDELVAQAEDGDAEAMFKLALRYYYGSDVEPDYDKAREWAQKAIDADFLPANILRDLPRD